MGQVINTNSLSLLTQNNLNKSQGALNTAIQRLSSGMRINSAKDDAAGQAIANRFTANIKGLTQASRNANDGISLAQTTEGALGEVNTNLQRIRELAVQSANGSNSDADKSSIQAEITQRLQEIDRTSKQTDFNGVKVLSSSAGKLTVQVGANDGEKIDIDLQEISAKTLGLTGFNVDGTGRQNTATAKSDLLIAGFATNGSPVNGTQQYDKTTTVNNAAATSANVFSKLATGDTVTNAAAVTTALGSQAIGKVFTYDKASDSFSYAVASASNALVSAALTPAAGGSTAAKVTIGTNASQEILIAGDGKITAADDKTVLFLDSSGNLTKTNAGGSVQATLANLQTSMNNHATPANSTGGTILSNGTTYTTVAGSATSVFAVTNAKISASALKTLADTGGYSASIAAVGTASSGTATVAAGGASVSGTGFTNVTASGAFIGSATSATTATYYEKSNGVVTDGSANVVYNDSATAGTFTLAARSGATVTADPLKALDAALSKVDVLRGALGAVQNRFDSVISNLGTTITNLTSSRSRIEDADYATEVSNMTRANILQQAGTSVLAQANQSTQGVLSLLR